MQPKINGSVGKFMLVCSLKYFAFIFIDIHEVFLGNKKIIVNF